MDCIGFLYRLHHPLYLSISLSGQPSSHCIPLSLSLSLSHSQCLSLSHSDMKLRITLYLANKHIDSFIHSYSIKYRDIFHNKTNTDYFFLNWQPRPLFTLFKQHFRGKTPDFSRIETRMIRVEGEQAVH